MNAPEETKHGKLATCSVSAICCGVALMGVFYFLSTPEGQAFNERLFARYYTLGMLLMMALYGAIAIGLTVLGLAFGVVGLIRRETPAWLRWLGLAASVFAPVATWIYLRSL